MKYRGKGWGANEPTPTEETQWISTSLTSSAF